MTSILAREDALVELQVTSAGCVMPEDFSGRPNEWLEKYTGEYAWETQRDVWAALDEHRAVAVLSCNNSGKTWLAARIVVKWIISHWRQGVRVVTTAPTAAQVRLLLWQEIRAAFDKARLRVGKQDAPGKIVASPYPQWKIGEVTVGFGRKPADHQQSAMQGVHAAYVLAVLDEAGGVAQPIWDAVDKITTNVGARVLAIGNPDDRNAPFGKVTRPGSGWVVIRIDGLRTPNFTREAIESGKYPLTRALMQHEGIPYSTEPVPDHMLDTYQKHLLHPLWVEERFTRWCGLDPDIANRLDDDTLGQVVADAAASSQLFTAAVRGDFPDTMGNSVIPLGWYRRAVERWKDWVEGDERRKIPPRAEQIGRRILGVDVATTNGADDTVVAVRQGWVVQAVHRYSEGDTHGTVAHVLEHAGGNLVQCVPVIDGIGIGAGVRDVLRNEHRMPAVSFEAYRQSDRTDRYGEYRFLNDRAAAWWRLRELLDPVKGVGLALPPDPRLEEELTAPTWKIRSSTKGGVIQIESKDEIRKRLGHSTDSADAVVQSTWVDGGPVDAGLTGGAIPWAKPVGAASMEVAVTPQARPSIGTGMGMIPFDLTDLGD